MVYCRRRSAETPEFMIARPREKVKRIFVKNTKKYYPKIEKKFLRILLDKLIKKIYYYIVTKREKGNKMFGILDSVGIYEETFDTIEEAKDFIEKKFKPSGSDYDDFKDIVIFEIVPKLKSYIPPKEITWINW